MNITFAAIVTPLLPMTYQKLYADGSTRSGSQRRRGPTVEQRLEQPSEVGGAVLEIGVEDRRPCPGRVPGGPYGEPRPCRGSGRGGPSSRLTGHFSSASSSRVPSVDPSSTTTSCRVSTGKLGAEGIVDGPLHRRQLVVDRHQDRQGRRHRAHPIPGLGTHLVCVGTSGRRREGTIAPCASWSSTDAASRTTRTASSSPRSATTTRGASRGPASSSCSRRSAAAMP